MAEQLTADAFIPYVDKVFRVKGGRLALTLNRVDVRPIEAWEAVTRQPFTLIFAGPPGDVLREGLHDLQVEDGPAFQLYVIPIQTFVQERQDYQAVFN
jgi:hypothetical protein